MNRKRNVNRKSNTSTKRKYKQKKTKRLLGNGIGFAAMNIP